MSQHRRVALKSSGENLAAAVRSALMESGILSSISRTSRVALKPNLTYPYYKKGVTTSPAVIRETVKILREYTDFIAIVESDGGYGAWEAPEAFRGHNLYSLAEEYGAEVINLCAEGEEREFIAVKSRGSEYQIPLPRRLLRETDLLITMPVPKIHCMTGLTLGYKNQWGCIPDKMRLRSHFVFNDAIIAINRALRPAVLADGTYFLDRNGPMEGDPVQMDFIIAATDVGSFDRYASELMGWSWRDVPHLRRAVALGDMPANLEEIEFNVHPKQASGRKFRLQRTPRNYIALSGFHSRYLTWFMYESWFGRVVLHSIFYAIVGKPVKPKPEQ
ncbi:MAG: DUF362 domain-containing protein [Deltaproteobacteria bacterium]